MNEKAIVSVSYIYKIATAFSYWINDKLYVIGSLNVMKLAEEGGRGYIFSCV